MTAPSESAGRSVGHAPSAPAAGAGDRLVPALLAAYRDLHGVRHDYPVVLSEEPSRPSLSSLAAHVDRVLAATAAQGPDPGLRSGVYRVETRFGRLAEATPGQTLGNLWQQAAGESCSEVRDPGRREALASGLAAVANGLPAADVVLPCRAASAESIAIHAWGRRRAELARHDAAALDDLRGRLADVLAADLAESPAAAAPDALRASMGGTAGFDFGALSSMLQGTRRYHEPPQARTVRLRAALSVIEAARRRLGGSSAGEAGEAGEAVEATSRPAVQPSCGLALDAWQSEVARRVAVVRAVRIANLELQNRYRPDRHDPLFESFDVDQLTAEERRALPPLLVCLDADRVDDREKSTLLEVLAGDIPIKVFLAVRALPGGVRAGTAGALEEWSGRIGEITVALGEAFVIQAPISALPGLADELSGLFAYPGPALLAVCAPPDDDDGLPAYVRSAAAAESRVFPAFVCDPGRGATFAERLSLAANTQPGERWPSHPLRYEDADGGPVEEQVAFTAADYLALDPQFRSHFRLDPDAPRNGRLIPLAEHVGATPAAASASTSTPGSLAPPSGLGASPDAAPFVLVVDDADRLHRAAVGPELVAFTGRVAARWERLQDLATPRRVAAAMPAAAMPAAANTAAGAAEQAVGPAPASSESQAAQTTAAAPEPAAQTTAAPAAAATLDAGPGSAPAAGAGAASVDSAFCTACNECTQRNSRMFAYNDARQAYIRDIRAGTFRELVDAAENCPVCIIHPGAPLDPSEPGIDELIARAAALN